MTLKVTFELEDKDLKYFRAQMKTAQESAKRATEAELLADVEQGTESLRAIVAEADGIQTGGDRLQTARHFANTLFNVMRGGMFDSGYSVDKADLLPLVHMVAELNIQYPECRIQLVCAGSQRPGEQFGDRIAQYELDALCFGLTLRRSGEEAKAGQGAGAATSMFKLYASEMNKRRGEVQMAVRGANALGWEGDGFTPNELMETRGWLRSKGNSIEGGTSEVQLNVIAKRVLGLPD